MTTIERNSFIELARTKVASYLLLNVDKNYIHFNDCLTFDFKNKSYDEFFEFSKNHKNKLIVIENITDLSSVDLNKMIEFTNHIESSLIIIHNDTSKNIPSSLLKKLFIFDNIYMEDKNKHKARF